MKEALQITFLEEVWEVRCSRNAQDLASMWINNRNGMSTAYCGADMDVTVARYTAGFSADMYKTARRKSHVPAVLLAV
jgi:hypothetical protein